MGGRDDDADGKRDTSERRRKDCSPLAIVIVGWFHR